MFANKEQPSDSKTDDKKGEKYYNKYIRKTILRAAICLPTTSPANAGFSVKKLINAW